MYIYIYIFIKQRVRKIDLRDERLLRSNILLHQVYNPMETISRALMNYRKIISIGFVEPAHKYISIVIPLPRLYINRFKS